MSIQKASARDLKYIEALSRKHAEELGFLTRTAMAAYLDRGRVTLAAENGDPCGYFLIGAPGERIRIFQACVQLDARGLGHAHTLLTDLIGNAAYAGASRITLHCRDGLESNGFWSACGFRSGGLILGGGARRKVVHEWELSICDALTNPAIPYAAGFLRTLRAGTQTGEVALPSPGIA